MSAKVGVLKKISHHLWLILFLPCSINLVLANSQSVSSSVISQNRLLDLSIEELMQIEVTSVSRRAQKLSQTASAIFVITQDDIRRSGATSIPEALRMAPGVEMTRVGANE